jgi:hypothetical protein
MESKQAPGRALHCAGRGRTCAVPVELAKPMSRRIKACTAGRRRRPNGRITKRFEFRKARSRPHTQPLHLSGSPPSTIHTAAWHRIDHTTTRAAPWISQSERELFRQVRARPDLTHHPSNSLPFFAELSSLWGFFYLAQVLRGGAPRR